ncbi:MAG: large conductance mechanosensitive channel protein MscL [Streptococcaceae bacterium]|jgi:large conductance mechanosensitive channel|nr:large conductance mechanosensitive channel protein MscL [Streptococcaceae bacterium]
MWREFKEFLSHRNVVDLAVGVIIGSALTTLVKSFVNDFINPLIGLVINRSQLAGLHFTIGKADFAYGDFINDFISFLLTAFIVFLVIKGMNQIFRKQEEVAESTQSEELSTLKEIRDLLKKDAD